MKILVTGGAGFIGSNFIQFMVKNHPDYEIINFDKLTYAGNLENLKAVEKHPNYKFIKGDITDVDLVNQIMPGVNVVVNFAAETHVDRSILAAHDFIKTNVLGTQVLLDAALKHQVELFHHISTDEVFGSLPLDSKEKFNPESPYKPSSPYSASKAAADHLVRSYHHTYGLPVTITNCSNNYGPFQFPEKFIALMIVNTLQNKRLPIYGDGLNVRDWIHVEDHCAAIDLVLQKGKVGETYLVGGDAERSNIDVALQILNVLNREKDLMDFVKDRLGHDHRYAIDSSKIEKELGFKRKYNFEDGLRQTVIWYRENQDWWQRLLSKEYLDYYEKQYAKR